MYSVFFISILLSSILGIYFYRKIAVCLSLVDAPNARSSHDRIVPRGGGLVFIVIFYIAVGSAWLGGVLEEIPWAFLGGLSAIALLSFLDDVFTLPSLFRLLAQLTIVSCSVYLIGSYEDFALGVNGWIWAAPYWVGFVLSVIWVVGLLNVFNFMDGIDGIAGLQAIVSLLGYAVLISLFRITDGAEAYLVEVLILGVLGFLYWNWSPAKVFMGDVGATFLGAFFALLPIHFASQDIFLPEQKAVLPLFGAFVMVPFLFDGIFTFVRRCKNRENVLQAHRSHLYQRLTRLGWGHGPVASLYGGWAIFGVLCGLLFFFYEGWQSVAIALALISGVGMALWVKWQEGASALLPVLEKKIYLSPPSVGEVEEKALLRVMRSGWVAPVGEEIAAFEQALERMYPEKKVVAVNSGTAALHLALLMEGVGAGDEVVCPTLTFIAPVNAVKYVGASPVFIDCAESGYCLDPELLRTYFESCRANKRTMPKAVIFVNLYGQSEGVLAVEEICQKFGVLLIEDAAEAVGAKVGDRHAGDFGRKAALSFNGNKVITTGGGGALICDSKAEAMQARYLASQAKLEADFYEHSEVGYNYRLSNVLAAIGNAQLMRLGEILVKRKTIALWYEARLRNVEEIFFQRLAIENESNNWLVNVFFKTVSDDSSPERLMHYLWDNNIEARRIWKPMHLQPLFANATCIGGSNAETLFKTGISLPSGTDLTEGQVNRICDLIVIFFSKQEVSGKS